jgi:hypothetical protein
LNCDNNTIDQAKNRNLINDKVLIFHSYEVHSDIELSDRDQLLLDKLEIPNIMEKKKSKSSTPPSKPTRSSSNY